MNTYLAYQAPHPRYRLLGPIGKGGMGEVFRAQDRLLGQAVALKRVSVPLRAERAAPVIGGGSDADSLGQALTAAPVPEPQRPSPLVQETVSSPQLQALAQAPARLSVHPELAATWEGPGSLAVQAETPAIGNVHPEAAPSPQTEPLRLHLTQEFRTLASLRHPHIVSVLDYGFDLDRQPFFTMELLDAAVPLDTAARDQPFAVKIDLVLQILQALSYLHRRGVLHRDLKPSNILVTSGPGGLHAKLLDFGLALGTQELRNRAAEIAGTLGYMAPEILVGAQPSEASDLFAVGVIAHELLLGAHPLGQLATAALIKESLGLSPLFVEDARLGPALSAVLRRALSRVPAERYRDALQFSRELAQAAGLPSAAETADIRESFLQAATFVARDQELATLRQALTSAASGSGSVWLVGGESGVGKSRLLDELRTLALVCGMRVARGQAVSAGGSAYQVWQGALRPLCLDAALSDLEAGVLRPIVPDIAALLEREIPEPPALDPQSAQARLQTAMEALLLSQRQPLVLLLEDLHWAEPASLAVLQRLTRVAARHPLMVVASYRHDERPALPDEVPGAQPLFLRRLSAAELTQLSTSMLGEVGRRPEVVSLLERETEGNAFFVVEVVRALAEEAGALERVGGGRIPSRVAAGGVQAVLARRLRRVPEEARPLLSAAAVLGRELDLAVLRALPEDIRESAERAIAACASASVLEVSENRWRFAHDKLREAVLAELPAEARARWHQLIGNAIEQAYSQDLGPHAAALGYHFDEAHELARALPYRLKAGESAMRSGAAHEAITHLERAMELQAAVGYTKAERAHAMGLLSRAYHSAGKPNECVLVLEKLFAEAGFRIPGSALALLKEILVLTAGHAWFRLTASSQRQLEVPPEIAWMRDIVVAFVATGEAVAMSRSAAHALHLLLAHVAVAEKLRDPRAIAPAYAGLAWCLSILPLRGLVDEYVRQAQQLLMQVPNPPPTGRAHVHGVAAATSISSSNWEQASEHLREEIVIRKQMGDWRQEAFAVGQFAVVALYNGQWAQAQERLAQFDAIASRTDIAQHRGWCGIFRAMIALHQGELDRAAQLLQQAEEQGARANDMTLGILVHCSGSVCLLRQGEARRALHRADSALELLRASMPAAYVLQDGLAGIVEIYFTLYSESSRAADQDGLHRRLKESLALLRRFGSMFPMGRSQAFRWHGRYAALCGYTRLAEWLLGQALQAAVHAQMPLDQALAHLAFAHLAELQHTRARAEEQRRLAREMFERLGARWYLAQMDAAGP